jgi:serine/threonine protein kinase
MSGRLTPGTQLGPYEIEGFIGAGGMGQVFRARDTRLGRRVAIKTLSGAAAADPGRLSRFETEARAAGAHWGRSDEAYGLACCRKALEIGGWGCGSASYRINRRLAR